MTDGGGMSGQVVTCQWIALAGPVCAPHSRPVAPQAATRTNLGNLPGLIPCCARCAAALLQGQLDTANSELEALRASDKQMKADLVQASQKTKVIHGVTSGAALPAALPTAPMPPLLAAKGLLLCCCVSFALGGAEGVTVRLFLVGKPGAAAPGTAASWPSATGWFE